MRPLIPDMPHPGPASHPTPPSPLRRLLRSQRTPVTGDTPLAANANYYLAVPVMHLEHNAVDHDDRSAAERTGSGLYYALDPGFMAFQLARHTRIVMLAVPV